MKKKLILFDWDGPFVVTHHLCYQIQKTVNPNMSWKDFQNIAKGNWWDEHEKASFVPVPDFGEKYRSGLFELEILSEMVTLIENLGIEYRLCIVSSNHGETILDYLKHKKLSHHFSDVLGHEHHTSKTHKIKKLLKKYKCESTDAFFVTDTSGDIHEAKVAGVRSIGVGWGVHQHETLKEAEPAYIVNEPHDIGICIRVLSTKTST